MSEWPIKTIAECASPEPYSTQIGPFGKALMAKEYTDSGVPVLRGVNVNAGRFYDDGFVFIAEEKADELSKYESHPGDVLLVHKGTLGEIGLMPESRKHSRYIMGNSMMRVRCDQSKLLPEYLYYWLSSPAGQHYLFSRISQVGVPQLQRPLTTLREAALPVPSLPEQDRITRILGTLDDKIELNLRMNRTLEAIAGAIFKSWFIDFDPVHAKAEGREPIDMDPETAALFPDSFQDSPLGKIPKGWEVGRLDELLELSRESIKPHEHPTEEFDHFSIPAYDAGGQTRECGETIRSSKYLVPPSGVLISKLNPHIPRVWFPTVAEERRSVCSTEFLVCVPREGISREFLYGLLSSTAFLDDFAQMVTGTTGSHQRVRPKAFTAMRVAKPSPKLLVAFTRSAELLFARCATAADESRHLAGTRDALLPGFLSGSLRVGTSRFAEIRSDEA